MTFPTFEQSDFDTFAIPGLEARMEAIVTRVRPKLQLIGDHMSAYLSELTGDPMYAHVAKHARRSVNPPNDTWVAWSNNRRGYKAHPHFQLGMFGSHLFIQFAVIYESANKAVLARHLRRNAKQTLQLVPDRYMWSMDHMRPEGTPHEQLTAAELKRMADKLETVKKSELLCGVHLPRDASDVGDAERLRLTTEDVFATLMPLYRASF